MARSEVEETRAILEIAEQGYQFLRDLAYAVGVDVALGVVAQAQVNGRYDVVTVRELVAWATRLGAEDPDIPEDRDVWEITEELAAREAWLMTPAQFAVWQAEVEATHG